MLRRFVVLRRKPGMSVEDFRDYWEQTHGPLIAKIPGLRSYVQYHVKSDRLDDADPEIDGIAELRFDDEEAQRAAYATPEYAAVVADEPNLFEMNSRHVHPVTAERVVNVLGSSPGRDADA